MQALAPLLLNGLSYASTLFLMASGLTLIFGVTRIVNFAHGSLFMLGALLSAHCLVQWIPDWADSGLGYGAVMLFAALCAAGVGAVLERFVLRRLYGVAELYQLVATFGVSLVLHDAMRWVFGNEEVFAPRFPGLRGAYMVAGVPFPSYQLATLLLGPVVWLLLSALMRYSLFGLRLRAVTQDRAMLSALGVNPAPLLCGVVLLGSALAGLGGALLVPREPANLQMDSNVVVETFVVVVTGGLGSVSGAFIAAALIGVVHAVGSTYFPQSTLVLVFLTMALVLALRPSGLMGKPVAELARQIGQPFVLALATRRGRWGGAVVWLVLAALLYFGSASYPAALVGDAMVLVIFGVSLQALMGLGGLVSFGHAAFFALGAYAAALANVHLAFGLPAALLTGCACSALLAACVGPVMLRSAGVYLAMLSLAFAQMVWALASQWTELTGGDNGLLGLQLVSAEGRGAFLVFESVLVAAALLWLQRLARSSLGAALQAVRDAPVRAAASGLHALRLRYRVFLASAAWAGLAGALMVADKGAVFPTAATVSVSLDVLLVVLLGGMNQLWGTVAGAALLVFAEGELGRGFEYWRGALGLVVVLAMLWAPSGLLGRRGSQRGA